METLSYKKGLSFEITNDINQFNKKPHNVGNKSEKERKRKRTAYFCSDNLSLSARKHWELF